MAFKLACQSFALLIVLATVGRCVTSTTSEKEQLTNENLLQNNASVDKTKPLLETARTISEAEARLASPPSLYSGEFDNFDQAAPLLPTKSSEVTLSVAQTPRASYGRTEPRVALGDGCSSDYECSHIEGDARCVGKVCACGYGTVPLANVACIPLAKFFGDRCVLSVQCKNLDLLATCYQDICMCEPIYHIAGTGGAAVGTVELGRQTTSVGCLKSRHSIGLQPTAKEAKLREQCKDSLQCAYKVWNSYCDSDRHTCKCNFGYTPIGDEQCGRLASALGQPCSVDAQCSTIMHAFCGPSGTCQCEDGERFVQVQTAGSDRRKRQAGRLQMCLPAVDLGKACVVDAQCTKKTRNAGCAQGNCRCNAGFVQRDPYVNECLPVIKSIGQHSPPCTISAQCLAKASFCNGTMNRCDCDKAHCAVGYKCLRKVWHEEPCENSCQCQTPHTICKDGWCQCKKDTCYSESAKTCFPKSLQFTANPYEFTAPCCGDLTRKRCFGQVMLDPSFLNCTGKPTFSPMLLGGDPSIIIDQNGGLFLSGSTTQSNFNNNQNQNSNTQLSRLQVTATRTFSITASTSDGLTAVTTVIVKPDACCTQLPTATTTHLTRVLQKLAPGPCVGAMAGAATVINAANLFDIPDLLTEPCGEKPSFTASFPTPGINFLPAAPPIPMGMCFVDGDFIGFQGSILLGSTARCDLVLVATGCNGQTATSTLTADLICPSP